MPGFANTWLSRFSGPSQPMAYGEFWRIRPAADIGPVPEGARCWGMRLPFLPGTNSTIRKLSSLFHIYFSDGLPRARSRLPTVLKFLGFLSPRLTSQETIRAIACRFFSVHDFVVLHGDQQEEPARIALLIGNQSDEPPTQRHGDCHAGACEPRLSGFAASEGCNAGSDPRRGPGSGAAPARRL